MNAPAGGEAPLIEVSGIVKRFGGLAALDGVDFTLAPGKLYAIIGPNGAGKTTLFNVITGILKPTAGQIRFQGEDITDAPVHRISRLGLARTLQIKSVFNGSTVAENLWIAVQSRFGVFQPFARARAKTETARKVDQLLEELGLTHLAHTPAGVLSYGDVALLEIGIALATEPKLLLLDEPICGMGPAETQQTVAKIKALSERINIIIIEHDIEVVFDVADDIIVMNQGAVLARGSPDEIAGDHAVRNAYLGDPDDV